MTRTLDRRAILVDAVMASLHLQLAYGVDVSPARIRQWASRGEIPRRRTGRYRYDLHDIIARATALGLLR